MSKHRDVGLLVQKLRNFLLGRSHLTSLRFAEELACRDYPDPCYPPGSREAISNNRYYKNDPRGEMRPPVVVAGDGAVPLLAAAATDASDSNKTAKTCAAGGGKMPATPGKVCQWDEHYFYKGR